MQAGMEDDGEEVYLPSGMGLVCWLKGLFFHRRFVCVWCRCTKGSAQWVLHPQAVAGIGRGMALTSGVCRWMCKHVGVSVCGKRSLGCLCPQ